MNRSHKPGLFPCFSILTGAVGFALQCLLFSSADNKGLLPENHFAEIMCYFLLALTLIVCWSWVQGISPSGAGNNLFPASVPAALGAALSAVGIGYTSFQMDATGMLRFALPVLGLLSAGALMVSAYCRLRGEKTNFLYYSILCAYFIFRTLISCKQWGTEPQLQQFFFPLLASIFLLIACYYRTELDISRTHYRRYLFFGQSAVFCCLLCLNKEDWVFYLSAGLWLTTDLCVLPAKNKE